MVMSRKVRAAVHEYKQLELILLSGSISCTNIQLLVISTGREDVNVLFILAFLTVFVFSSLIEYYKQKKEAS